METVGTFFLLTCMAQGALGGLDTMIELALAGGFVLTGLAYMGWHISGAHYNPVVTIGLLINGNLEQWEALKYILAQLAGAALGASWIIGINGDEGVGLLEYSTTDLGKEVWQGMALEALATFLMFTIIFQVAVNPKVIPNQFYGLGIGMALFAAILVYPGGIFNPAIALSSNLIAWLHGANITDIWICITGPLIGGLVGIWFYKWIIKEQAMG